MKDIEGIMKVEKEAFHLGIVEKEEVFLERIDAFSEGFLVLEENKEAIEKNKQIATGENIIGYVCGELWSYKEDPKDYTFTLGHSIKEVLDVEGTELYIASMGLLKDSRRSGLGRKMFLNYIEFMKKQFPHIKSVILMVCESWIGPRKIYKEAGFIEIGEEKDFFDFGTGYPKEKGIIMRRFFFE